MKEHEPRVRFVQSFRVGYFILLRRTYVFWSTAEGVIQENYNKL